MAVNSTIKRKTASGYDEIHPKTSTDQVEGLATALANVTIDALNDIADVNAPSPSDDQALVWDSTTSKWIPQTISFSDDDTTYTISAVDSGNDAIIRLTAGGSGSGTDDVKLVAGSNITLTPSGDNITIAATDTNTTYSAGSGLSLTGTVFANTAPDQTVSLTGSGATTVSGTYPNFTISSTDTTTNNYLTGVSGSGDGTVTFTRQGLGNLTWDASHSHSEYAPLASPALTGTPTAPTANSGTNTTQIATTAFVANALNGVAGGLNFAGSISLSTAKNGDELASAGLTGPGDYLIVTATGNIQDTGTFVPLAVQAPGDEGDSLLPVTLETGDWIVYVSGTGGTMTVAIINNTDTRFAPTTHTHTIANVTGLQTAIDGKVAKAGDTMTGALTLPATGALHNLRYNFTSGQAASRNWFVGNDAFQYGAFNISTETAQGNNTLLSRFHINSSGNVGIGTNSPGSKLEVSGGVNVGGTGTVADASLHIKQSYGGFDRLTQIQPTGNSKPALNLMSSTDSSGTNQWWSWGVNANVFTIKTGTDFTGSNGLFINSSGDVGIGVTNPNVKLVVGGKTRIEKAAQASGADDYTLELYAPNSGVSTGEISLRFHQGGQWYGQLRYRSDGFHFTQGNNNTYYPISASTVNASQLNLSGQPLQVSGSNLLYDGDAVWHEGNFNPSSYLTTSGKAADSNLLDGIDSSGFIRVSANSSSPLNANFAIGSASSRNFIQSHNSQPLDINPLGNTVTINGNTAWHAGNDGSGSGLDADLLDGYNLSGSATPNTVVLRDGNNYIYAGYINSNRGNEATAAASYIYDSGDGWMRKKTLANAQSEIVTAAAVGAHAPLETESSWITAGNASWGGRLRLGGNGGGSGAATISVVQATDGNLHLDPGTGKATYLNYYTNGTIYLNGTTYSISSNGSYYNGTSASSDALSGYGWTSSGKNVRATEFYADNWFRNYNANEGLYNENTQAHWMSRGAGNWTAYTTAASTEIRFETSGQARRGSVYADNGNNFGFLDEGGNWTLRVDDSVNTWLTGGLVVSGSINSGGYEPSSQYEAAGTNIILKGDSLGRSGIFFESEKDGTNINHTSDFGYIQFFSYGVGGSSGESNELVIGVSNDQDDHLILNAPNNGLKYRNGATSTDYTIWSAFNFDPNSKLNTSGGTISGNLTVNGTGSFTDLEVSGNTVWSETNLSFSLSGTTLTITTS